MDNADDDLWLRPREVLTVEQREGLRKFEGRKRGDDDDAVVDAVVEEQRRAATAALALRFRDRLAELRAASPTPEALAQLAEFEARLDQLMAEDAAGNGEG